MTIIIQQDEAKELAKAVFAGCITLMAGTLLTRKVIVDKVSKINKKNES